MENQIRYLPIEIQWHIMKFTRHPVADIVVESRKFKFFSYRGASVHGSAFDRGSADAYYWRDRCPHKVVDRKRDNQGRYYDVRVDEHNLTPTEIEAYNIGYDYQESRK